jgi:Phage integrase, N-terminal SAM-like domain
MSEPITSDNIHLSRPKPVLVHASAVDSTCLPEAVASYVRDSLAENTRRAYQSDLRHFEVWGGSLPASPQTVAAYLAAHADCLSVTTLIRRLATLSKAHQADRDGQGHNIAIPHGRSRWCPVACLDAWLSASSIAANAIFRPVDRYGRVHNARLSGEAVSILVRERIAAAGLDPTGYSGHSLRAGLATSAAQAGVSAWRIKAQTRHASEAMLAHYIRQGELFTDNAAGALL